VTTLVFLHAHPDDEALLTAGTMARAAAEGQRVVLVVATDGAEGLASSDMSAGGLAARRAAELDASAAALGVHRVVRLPYADSGLHGDAVQQPGGPLPWCAAPFDEAVEAVAAVLREERADVPPTTPLAATGTPTTGPCTRWVPRRLRSPAPTS